jgi:hypothetical protein
MNTKGFSVREELLKNSKIAFNQMLESIEYGPSKPVIVRRLTKVFNRRQNELGVLCDTMENRLRQKGEELLKDYEDQLNKTSARVATKVVLQPGEIDPAVMKKSLKELKKIADVREEYDRRCKEYLDSWKEELEREVQKITDRFFDEASVIVSRGIAANVEMEFLDPDKSTKQ